MRTNPVTEIELPIEQFNSVLKGDTKAIAINCTWIRCKVKQVIEFTCGGHRQSVVITAIWPMTEEVSLVSFGPAIDLDRLFIRNVARALGLEPDTHRATVQRVLRQQLDRQRSGQAMASIELLKKKMSIELEDPEEGTPLAQDNQARVNRLQEELRPLIHSVGTDCLRPQAAAELRDRESWRRLPNTQINFTKTGGAAMLKEVIRDGVEGTLRAVQGVVNEELRHQGIPESSYISQRIASIDAEPDQPPTTVLEFAAATMGTGWMMEPFLRVKVSSWMEGPNLLFSAEAEWRKEAPKANAA